MPVSERRNSYPTNSNRYGKSRVAFVQLGHDHFAYENPSYRKLVAQAIQWTAGK